MARGTPSSELGAWSPKEAGWWHLCPHHAAGKGVPGCQRAAGRWLMVNPPMLRVPRAMQPGSATGSGDAGCTACDRDAADGALPSPSTRLVACRAACVGLQGGFCIPVLHLHPCVAPWHPCAASPHPCAAFPHLSAAPACTCCISAPVRCISVSQALQPCCPCPCFTPGCSLRGGDAPEQQGRCQRRAVRRRFVPISSAARGTLQLSRSGVKGELSPIAEHQPLSPEMLPVPCRCGFGAGTCLGQGTKEQSQRGAARCCAGSKHQW